MRRTRAEALALVNWKGVFYERYLLDRHVTALEGANGAGKTTVMIAAYLVLLPDMTRLRFTNLGETGATGGDKGIWGRLGEPGRPSYAVLDFALPDGRRLVAGVHLERKGEPSVEPTPFVIAGLEAEVRLQELLLVPQGGGEGIPELADLRENAARLGGRLHVFGSARDYFAELFDAGVLPLRLSTDEERNKLNEMLRTSMTGGISRALTTELRSFLLKEEGGLAETLKRMTDNLAACKRTRGEVEEARRLEGEIRRVFEAGQTMFAAAFAASRERAEELQRKVAESEKLLVGAEEAVATAKDALARVEAEQREAARRRDEVGAELEAWRDRAARLKDALAAAARVSEARDDLSLHETATAEAERHRDEAARKVERAIADRDAARAGHRRAAAGLADFQAGLELLHRHAAAHAEFVRRLAEAERLLAVAGLPLEDLDSPLCEVRAALEAADRERREATVRLADADHHHAAYGRVLAAVGRLAGVAPAPAAAHEAARAELRRYREREALAGRLPAILAELEGAERLATRQAEIRRRATELGLPSGDEPGSASLRALLGSLELERDRLEEAVGADRATLAETQRAIREAAERLDELGRREPLFRELAARAVRLAEATSVEVIDGAGLERARAAIRDRELETRGRVVSLRVEVERLHGEVRELSASGGSVPPELLALRDRLGADLLASSYEEVGVDEAGPLEARLGPAVQALVVDDLDAAVRAVADRPEALASVWLVGREGDRALPQAPRGGTGNDVVVDEGTAWRVSRIPARPRLGRKARERRAAELRREADETERLLEEAGTALRVVERLGKDGDQLLAGRAIWLAGDPRPQLEPLRKLHADRQAEATLLRGRIEGAVEEGRRLRGRIDALRRLLVDAALLDPPDHERRAATLRGERDAAREAEARVVAASADARIVEEDLELLRRPPLGDEEREELRRRLEFLKAERDRLDRAAEALGYVAGHLEARAWGDAAERLRAEGALRPDLEAQVARAAEREIATEAIVAAAESTARTATSDWQDADGRRRAGAAALEEAEGRFAGLGIPAPTEEGRREAEERVGRLVDETGALGDRLLELAQERGGNQRDLEKAEELSRQASEQLALDRRDAAPAIGRWERLQARATELALIGSTESPLLEAVRGSLNFQSEAAQRKAALIVLLRAARGGDELATRIEKGWELSELTFGDMVLEKWLAVRDWLRSRLPAQLAEADDPREGLERLADRLSGLEDRLARQEKDLQGESGDIARGIEGRIRKAQGQVRRLNVGLADVRFGSIHGIRVRFGREERMEGVLRALKEGAVQGLLFHENVPFEEALDEIFRRYAGGRSGGQRLLDHREYVHLKVEVRRGAGTDWEDANPTRLSTGEAIGVGAALMMVVLTAWEQEANVLRGKRSTGSLRFLFLDEANRLSKDNLGTLFDLCRSLDLQLLIAAPEVARADGNTTYRLVRRILGEGSEEVIVSGRRVRAEA